MSDEKQITPESIIPNVENQSYDTFEDFYKSIPYEGSLGILALGAAGLLAWRKKRAEIDEKKANSEENSNG